MEPNHPEQSQWMSGASYSPSRNSHTIRRSSLAHSRHAGASPGHGDSENTGLAGCTILNTVDSVDSYQDRTDGQTAKSHHEYGAPARMSSQTPKVENGVMDRSFQSGGVDLELVDLPSEDDTDDEEAGLTRTDRRRRKRRRKQQMLLHERVAGDSTTATEGGARADVSVLRRLAINALLIGAWFVTLSDYGLVRLTRVRYTFSLSISVYNKWMFDPKHLNFQFPLFTTSMHMVVQFSLASLVLFFIPRFRPRATSISNPDDAAAVENRKSRSDQPLMTLTYYFSRIAPCGAATGLDIGLGNMSLRYITLTFFTMCKSSALAFVLLFAFIFQLETPSVKLVLIIATMTIGVVMMVAGETAFNVLGFILILSSSFFSGFRWALTQILLLRNPATSNPFSGIFFLAPVMFVTLSAIAIPIEGFGPLAHGLHVLTTAKGVVAGIALLLFPGLLAFCMTAAEFALLRRTSVVTLSICGIFKEVVTISAGGIVFHDPLSPINVGGLVVTIVSIAAYNYVKIKKMRRDARGGEGEGRDEAERETMLVDGDGDGDENKGEGEGRSIIVLDARGPSGTLEMDDRRGLSSARHSLSRHSPARSSFSPTSRSSPALRAGD